mmetsp:Transcript_8545/g.29141  ORF Transcript_8545/g.29141 Transcript_8545/m.29141 type:complete len:238 (+) Transcript_8545:426-1139(+)
MRVCVPGQMPWGCPGVMCMPCVCARRRAGSRGGTSARRASPRRAPVVRFPRGPAPGAQGPSPPTGRRGPHRRPSAGSHALDLVVHLLVELAEALEVLLGGVPVAAAVGLEEGGHHVAEGVGVCLEEALLHLGVRDEHLVGVLVDKVVHRAGGGGPAHGVAEALRDLARALVAALEHALVELWVEQLGARVEAHGLREGAHLGVGRGGVRHEGGGLLAVLAQARDHLGRVRVEVVAHV